MIKLVEKKVNKEKVSEPYYLLVYNYMIGDANGDTTEEVEISKDNPFLERYCILLNSLKPVKGRWGVMLESARIASSFSEGQITEDDYKFLMRTMFIEDLEDWEEEEEEELLLKNYFKTEQDNNWADEFFEGVRAEADYSFLVFQGVSLTYVDEYGIKHGTYFEN